MTSSIFYLYSKSMSSILGGEIEAAEKVFGINNVSDRMSKIPKGSTVIPRMRFLPFGKELEQDVKDFGSELINTYSQHRNIADITNWAYILDTLTPPVHMLEDLPKLSEGEYFVKGETNSIKNDWFRSAYAPNKKKLIEVVSNVLRDNYVGNQKLVIRPFQNFRKIGETVTGQPIFHERRIFVLDGKILSEAEYWSPSMYELGNIEILDNEKYKSTLEEAIARTRHLARFYVVDLAEYPDGSWKVVELNDGVQSGLSENTATELWTNFSKEIKSS